MSTMTIKSEGKVYFVIATGYNSLVKRYYTLLLLILISGFLGGWIMRDRFYIEKQTGLIEEKPQPIGTAKSSDKQTENMATISAVPSTKKMSFEEMNKKYGPCAPVKVLMYHHIEVEAEAIRKKRSGLAVDPKYFRMHMQYLKDKEYSVISAKQLVDYFDNGTPLPPKAVLITFDDAYEDNYVNAFPILKEFGFKAIIFTPTGLVSNPDYLSWQQIKEMNSTGLVSFGNHTWSHHGAKAKEDVLDKEIGTANDQLAENALNSEKTFAYPYGSPSGEARNVLNKYGYKLAFTTSNGNIMCKELRYVLPRIRVGNAQLNRYGI